MKNILLYSTYNKIRQVDTMSKKVKCYQCKGSGKMPGGKRTITEGGTVIVYCTVCNGEGKTIQTPPASSKDSCCDVNCRCGGWPCSVMW